MGRATRTCAAVSRQSSHRQQVSGKRQPSPPALLSDMGRALPTVDAHSVRSSLSVCTQQARAGESQDVHLVCDSLPLWYLAGAGGGAGAGEGGAAAGSAGEGAGAPGAGPELPEGLRDIFANGGMKLVGKDGVERTFGDLDTLAAEAQRQKAELESRTPAKDEL